MADEKLSAAQRSKIRRIANPKELAPDEEGGELNIVPFLDIIVNILIFVLATVAVTFTATIETTPPAARGSGVRADTLEERAQVLDDDLLLPQKLVDDHPEGLPTPPQHDDRQPDGPRNGPEAKRPVEPDQIDGLVVQPDPLPVGRAHDL